MKHFFSSKETQQKENTFQKLTPEQEKKHIISESQLYSILSDKKKVVLLEPNYKRKHVPIGLAKIATFIKSKGGAVQYSRTPVHGDFDCVCITSLFTYDSGAVLHTINGAKRMYKNVPIILGGIFASLMPEYIINKTGAGVLIFKGCADFLDDMVPDYSIDWDVEAKWNDFSYVFTTRGCVNKCAYCLVHKIEPELKIVHNWKDHVVKERGKVLIRDNNITAQPKKHLFSVLDYLASEDKLVTFDSGLDCKYITEELANKLAKIKLNSNEMRRGLRIAFDRIEENGVFQEAVQKLLSAGIPSNDIMAYVLFNFVDTPKDANFRMMECVKLGIRPYPQRYVPLKSVSRLPKYVGKYWSAPLATAFRSFWLVPSRKVGDDFGEYLKSPGAKRHKITEDDIQIYERENKCRRKKS